MKKVASYLRSSKDRSDVSIDAPLLRPSAEEISSRFFYGDTALLAKLSSGYGIKQG